MNLSEDVQKLDENQGCEVDTHDIHKGIVEEDDTREHYHCSLIDRDPNPDQEGLEVERPTQLKGLVEGRVAHDGLTINILV